MGNLPSLSPVSLTGEAKLAVRANGQLTLHCKPSLPSQISHIIREIRQFQQAPYRIEHQPKVCPPRCLIHDGGVIIIVILI